MNNIRLTDWSGILHTCHSFGWSPCQCAFCQRHKLWTSQRLSDAKHHCDHNLWTKPTITRCDAWAIKLLGLSDGHRQRRQQSARYRFNPPRQVRGV